VPGGFPDRPRPNPGTRISEGRVPPTDDDQPLPWSTDEVVGDVRTVDLAAEALPAHGCTGRGDPPSFNQAKSPRSAGAFPRIGDSPGQTISSTISSRRAGSTLTPGPIVDDTVIARI
jgi:hypothetical protein